MPASLPSSAGVAPGKSVLLVEEYNALAAAIGSALKKFAPDYTAQIARSLAEAETLAAELQPSLFVLDFDPPHPGGIAFFSKMKGLYPDARVLVLAAAKVREIAAEVGSAGALHFIEKPFELAGFGAAVQALLGPWAATASSSARGTLRHLGLMDVLQLKCFSSATEMITVEAPGGRAGEIHFREGQICHATAMTFSGSEALEAMLRWREVRFAEEELPSDAPKTIPGSWKIVLLRALRQVKEADELARLPEPQGSKARKEKVKTGKKIVVIDDTEMLLIFVEDVLSSTDQGLDILTASTGLDGLRLAEKNAPDLILLDYCLPDIKGDEVCRRLLANEQTARIPIVMMSGHVPEMGAVAARYENVVATIAKPFLSQALIDLVHKTLAEGKIRVRASPPAPKPEPLIYQPSIAPSLPSPALSPPIPKIASSAIPVVASTVLAPAAESSHRATENEVVLGLPLEVTSMQLTPLFKIGSVRAKPSALAVSLRVRSNLLRGPRPLEIGFELGPVQLDAHGRIDTMRLVPTRRSIDLPQAEMPSFAIGAVEVVSTSARPRVQITPTVRAPMTMQLLAHFQLLAVELTPNCEVGALLVKAHEGSVRVTLDSHASAPEENAATFEYVSVKLDGSGRIAELSLTPLD